MGYDGDLACDRGRVIIAEIWLVLFEPGKSVKQCTSMFEQSLTTAFLHAEGALFSRLSFVVV